MLPPERPDDPALGQTEETIGVYLRGLAPGGEVAIRTTQGGIVGYEIVTVADVAPSKGKLYLEKEPRWGGRGFYLRTGKNAVHPKGQTRLVEPTEAVREFASKYGFGTSVRYETNLATGQPYVSDEDMARIMERMEARNRR